MGRLSYRYAPELIQTKGRMKFIRISCHSCSDFQTDHCGQCFQRKERISCVKCKDLLVEPFQIDCGCRICSHCLEECNNICPECVTDCTSTANKSKITFDRAAEREILGLEINCINELCQHRCKLVELISHLEKCEYTRMRVEYVTCCGVEFTKEDYNGKHRNINGDISLMCDNWKGVCPHNCSDEVIENIKIHLTNCPRMIVECPMKEVGCSKRLPRFEIDDHVRNDISYHMTLMTQEIIKLKTENERIKSVSLKINDKQNTEIKLLKETIADSTIQINNLKEKTSSCEKNYQVLLIEASLLKQTLNSTGIIKFFPRNSASSSINSDGFFVWEVDNIINKIKDAKMGINTDIFSDHLYSHNPGYKMCLKMYPAGDGQRAENHMSMYFVILKGEYDDVVSWPFKQKISISLQSNHSSIKNRTINMKPDTNGNCYGKPVSAYNLAAGQPKFISHVELIGTDEFIDNGSITIHAKVW